MKAMTAQLPCAGHSPSVVCWLCMPPDSASLAELKRLRELSQRGLLSMAQVEWLFAVFDEYRRDAERVRDNSAAAGLVACKAMLEVARELESLVAASKRGEL